MSLPIPSQGTAFKAADDEFQRWYKELRQTSATSSVDTPDILGPGGLPDGWQVRAHARLTSGWGDPAVVCLVSRTGGGWLLAEQESGYARSTTVRLHAETLALLYEAVCLLVDDPVRSLRQWTPTEKMMGEFVSTFYDRCDVEEAAEQVLVGLGGRPHLLPAALPV
jgi:hypothetical protein